MRQPAHVELNQVRSMISSSVTTTRCGLPFEVCSSAGGLLSAESRLASFLAFSLALSLASSKGAFAEGLAGGSDMSESLEISITSSNLLIGLVGDEGPGCLVEPERGDVCQGDFLGDLVMQGRKDSEPDELVCFLGEVRGDCCTAESLGSIKGSSEMLRKFDIGKGRGASPLSCCSTAFF